MSQSYGEQFDSAMKCETPEQGAAWMEKEIQYYYREFQITAAKARQTILINLGYMAGYYGRETQDKVLRVFGAAHPILGTRPIETPLTADVRRRHADYIDQRSEGVEGE